MNQRTRTQARLDKFRPPSVILSAAKDLHSAWREILSAAKDDSRAEVHASGACPALGVVYLPAEAIADAAHGLDQFGVGGVFLQFFAQPAHMHIDGACIAHVVVAPHVLQQLVACEHGAAIARQVGALKWALLSDDAQRKRCIILPVTLEGIHDYTDKRAYLRP